jgi:hypothetical protein
MVLVILASKWEGNRMDVFAPPRQPLPTDSVEHDSVEALIEEARRRARRRRWFYVAAAATVGVVGAILFAARNDATDQSPARRSPAVDAVAGEDLGVFQPVRGWIVYPVARVGPRIDHGLEAVDPTAPSTRHTIALPESLQSEANLVPAGWSADGSRLALTDEYNGDLYVMDSTGAMTRVPAPNTGCCSFVTFPWLAPDGTTAIAAVEPERLQLVGLGDSDGSRVVELAPPVMPPAGNVEWGFVLSPAAAWSPDGSQIAYTAHRTAGTDLMPSVHVTDLETGTSRQLIGPAFGHIRQMAWSPDGSQLLLIAGPWRHPTTLPILNPMVLPQKAGLYLVNPDGSALHEIAYGHYVAAAWSPDGTQIAAIDFAPLSRQLVVMNADGNDSRVLVELYKGELFTGVAWHPVPDQ